MLCWFWFPRRFSLAVATSSPTFATLSLKEVDFSVARLVSRGKFLNRSPEQHMTNSTTKEVFSETICYAKWKELLFPTKHPT